MALLAIITIITCVVVVLVKGRSRQQPIWNSGKTMAWVLEVLHFIIIEVSS